MEELDGDLGPSMRGRGMVATDARDVEALAIQAPRVEDVLQPATVVMPTATWIPVYCGRSAYLNIKGSSAFTIYFTPAKAPPTDLNLAHSVTSNKAHLYARGQWWVRQDSGATVTAYLFDAAGAIGGDDSLFGGSVSDPLSSILGATLTMGTPALTACTTSSGQKVAANTARRALYLKNTSTTSGEIITYRFGGTAVSLTGYVLEPGDWHYFGPLDRVPTAAVIAISATGSPNLASVEST